MTPSSCDSLHPRNKSSAIFKMEDVFEPSNRTADTLEVGREADVLPPADRRNVLNVICYSCDGRVGRINENGIQYREPATGRGERPAARLGRFEDGRKPLLRRSGTK